jgi:hypothetical protein
MTVRADHVAGAFLVAAGLLVFALSGDLPFGSLAFPGAGFLPKLIATLIIVMGALLFFGAARSAPFQSLGWSDLRHAGPVLAVAAAATVLYDRLGFVITLALMMLALLVLIERKSIIRASIYSFTVVVLAYFLFTVLRAPIPIGPFGF